MKLPLIAALVAGSPMASSAFTLDAVGYEGGELSLSPVSIFVPGYGCVIFETGPGSILVLDSAYSNDFGFRGPSLSFDQNDAIKITFGGLPTQGVDFGFISLSAENGFGLVEGLATPQTFFAAQQGGAKVRGLQSVSWKAR